jgi:hypothetical protein
MQGDDRLTECDDQAFGIRGVSAQTRRCIVFSCEEYEEVEEGAQELGEYAEAGAVGCLKGAAESAAIAGPDAAEGGCGYGAVSGVLKHAGCAECSEAVDLYSNVKDFHTAFKRH